MFVHKYQPCPVQAVNLEYAGPLVSVAVIIITIIAVVCCCLLQRECSLLSICLFCSGYTRCCSIRAVSHQNPLSSILLRLFHQDQQLSWFWFLLVLHWVLLLPNLMSCWLLIIFMIDLSVTLGEFPSRFLWSDNHFRWYSHNLYIYIEREREREIWSNDHIGVKLTVTKHHWLCV